MAYTKLFSSIVTSTIWSEDDKTRIVWITMLAIADKNGEVHGSVPGLARVAGVPVDACRDAIAKFLSPDLDSRTKDDEGRRIEEIDGGWSLLNHQKYREMASKDEMRESEAKRKARYRARVARNNGGSVSQNVPDMSRPVPKSQHIAEADTDTDTDTEANVEEKKKRRATALSLSRGTEEDLKSFTKEIGLPESDGQSMFYHWEANGWKNGSSAVKDWKAGIRKWKSQGWLPSQKAGQNGGYATADGTKKRFPHHDDPGAMDVPDLYVNPNPARK